MSGLDNGALLQAVRDGTRIDCRHNGVQDVVDPVRLRGVCGRLGRESAGGLWLFGAHIAGCLDLSGQEIKFPVRLDACSFRDSINIEGSDLHELIVTNATSLPGVRANGLRVRRDLDLSGSLIAGEIKTSASTSKTAAVWLCEAHVGGRLLLVGTKIRTSAWRAIQADRIHVAGNMRLINGFEANSEIRLIGANIGGSLDLTGAQLGSKGGLALDLADVVVEGSVFLVEDEQAGTSPTIDGRIDLGSAKIAGQFLIKSLKLHGSRLGFSRGTYYSGQRRYGTAISAARLAVGAQVSIEKNTTIVGGIDFAMSDISSLTIGGDCRIEAAGETALDLTNAELRSHFTASPGTRIQGTIRLGGARVHGDVALVGALISDPDVQMDPNHPTDRWLLAAQGVTVDGDVTLRNLDARGGQIRFRSANVGGVFDANGANISHPDGMTLNLHQAIVGGSVRLVRFTSNGLVSLNRAVIEGRLDATTATFGCPGPTPGNLVGHAVEAISATVRAGMFLRWSSLSPSIDLTSAMTTILADDLDSWPAQTYISGFIYDRFDSAGSTVGRDPDVWNLRKRLRWLRNQADYDAGPYEQAARVYRQHGRTSQAERILIAQRTDMRHSGSETPVRGIRDALYGWTVGYGYRPGRAFSLLLALLALLLLTLSFTPVQGTLRATDSLGHVYATTDPCGDGRVRCFDQLSFAIDTVVPLISLGQKNTWYVNTKTGVGQPVQWGLNLTTFFGWLLTTVLVLSFARLARSPWQGN